MGICAANIEVTQIRNMVNNTCGGIVLLYFILVVLQM